MDPMSSEVSSRVVVPVLPVPEIPVMPIHFLYQNTGTVLIPVLVFSVLKYFTWTLYFPYFRSLVKFVIFKKSLLTLVQQCKYNVCRKYRIFCNKENRHFSSIISKSIDPILIQNYPPDSNSDRPSNVEYKANSWNQMLVFIEKS